MSTVNATNLDAFSHLMTTSAANIAKNFQDKENVPEYVHSPSVDGPQGTHAELSEYEAFPLLRQEVHVYPAHLPDTSCRKTICRYLG